MTHTLKLNSEIVLALIAIAFIVWLSPTLRSELEKQAYKSFGAKTRKETAQAYVLVDNEREINRKLRSRVNSMQYRKAS